MQDDVRSRCEIADIDTRAIQPVDAIDFVSDPAHGGLAVFIGKVRETNHGHQVVAVHYDMFDPLVLAQFARAVQSARDAHGRDIKVFVAHAKGRLQVGDVAVVVAVGSVHRDEAFRACREVIEFVKHQAPIWKQEHYVDGSSEWSEGCSLCDVPATHAHVATSHPHRHPIAHDDGAGASA